MKLVLIVIVILLAFLLFRYSGYEGDCTSKNSEFLQGMRCYDQNDKVNLSGPFCKEKCEAPSTWK